GDVALALAAQHVRPGDSEFDEETPHESHPVLAAVQVDSQDREAVLLMQLQGTLQDRDPLDARVAPRRPEDDEDDLVLKIIEADLGTVDVSPPDGGRRPTDEVEPPPVAGEMVADRGIVGALGDEVADLGGEVKPP